MSTIKHRLMAGELLLGTMISEVRNPNVAYLLAQAGFEFFIIDNEHGSFSSETVSSMIAAARGTTAAAVVRIPEIRRETILKPLDAGAAGLMVPQVQTREQAQEVVLHAKYPPEGNRGAALRRAHSRYARIGAEEYLKRANDDLLIAVQVESAEAVENADQIASVQGIDCIFAGPFDLSISLGVPGQTTHKRVVQAVDVMLQACRKHGKAAGILLFDTKPLKEWIAKGMRFVAYSGDVMLLADAAADAVKELKGMVGEK